MDVLQQRELDVLVNRDAPPYCPKCGSLDGSLGTQGLYFMCRSCDGNQWYCKGDYTHTQHCGDYSPFYRKSGM